MAGGSGRVRTPSPAAAAPGTTSSSCAPRSSPATRSATLPSPGRSRRSADAAGICPVLLALARSLLFAYVDEAVAAARREPVRVRCQPDRPADRPTRPCTPGVDRRPRFRRSPAVARRAGESWLAHRPEHRLPHPGRPRSRVPRRCRTDQGRRAPLPAPARCRTPALSPCWVVVREGCDEVPALGP